MGNPAQNRAWQQQQEWEAGNRPPSARGIERVKYEFGSESAFGSEGYCTADPIQLPVAFPARLHDLYSPAEWMTFGERMLAASRSVTRNSGCCMMMCLPFLLCASAYRSHAEERHERALQAAIETENERIAACGLRWVTPDVEAHRPCIDLTWVDGVRQQWEAAHPHRRRVSAEPFPFHLLPLRTQHAVQDMARTRLAMLGPAAALEPAARAAAAAAGYPLGFDMSVLDYFAPGVPPDFDGNAAAAAGTVRPPQRMNQAQEGNNKKIDVAPSAPPYVPATYTGEGTRAMLPGAGTERAREGHSDA